jgi:predicted branched-subunit amino acid permease
MYRAMSTDGARPTTETGSNEMSIADSRRRVAMDTLGLAVSSGGFGLVYGLAARTAGLSVIEVAAMSVLVFGGGSQFAALGYIAAGAPWISTVLLTAFINARHLLYGAALAPYVARKPLLMRMGMAHFLNDETFAISVAHFRRIGRADLLGYWIGALGGTGIPWITATVVGAAVAESIPDPTRFGLDVIFPAAMAGLAVGLISERRELAAAVSGAIIGIAVALAWEPAAGIVAGGIAGPLVGFLVPKAQVGGGK